MKGNKNIEEMHIGEAGKVRFPKISHTRLEMDGRVFLACTNLFLLCSSRGTALNPPQSTGNSEI